MDPADPAVDRAGPPPFRVWAVHQSGEPRDKVDLLLMGDGYTAAEMPLWHRDAQRLADMLFAVSPFKERRGDFNVWAVDTPSEESGVSRPSDGIHRRSALRVSYDAFGSERYVLAFDNKRLREAASAAPYEFIEIAVNERKYGGGGIFNLYATVAAQSAWAPYLFVHEFAHHFAGLADEYYTSPVAYATGADGARPEPWEANATADPLAAKWKDLVTPGTPLPTPWPKEEFEAAQREIQARRRKIREEKRPEEEMDALFREERRRMTALLHGSAHARLGGRLRGRDVRGAGLPPPGDRLHHVHPQRSALLRGLPPRPRAHHRPVHARARPLNPSRRGYHGSGSQEALPCAKRGWNGSIRSWPGSAGRAASTPGRCSGTRAIPATPWPSCARERWRSSTRRRRPRRSSCARWRPEPWWARSPRTGAIAPPLSARARPCVILKVAAPAFRQFAREEPEFLEGLFWTQVDRVRSLTREVTRTHEKAITDALTRLYNHGFFRQRLEIELERARATGDQVSLVLFDIDHFKKYNDTYGHEEGNEVLLGVAQIMKGVGRRGDIIARYGGEEFVALLYGASCDEARTFAETVRRAVEKHGFAEGPGREPRRITISGGCATFPQPAGSEDELIKLADEKLYQAKDEGRNRVVV